MQRPRGALGSFAACSGRPEAAGNSFSAAASLAADKFHHSEEVILNGEEEVCEEEGHQEEGCEEEEVIAILDLARPRGLVDIAC